MCKSAGIECSYENAKNGFRFAIHRPVINSSDIIVANNDTKNVTSNSENVTSNTENVTSNTKNVTSYDDLGKTELAVLEILMKKERLSREEISDMLCKTVRTVQRALNSLRDKGYIERIGAKQYLTWGIVDKNQKDK